MRPKDKANEIVISILFGLGRIADFEAKKIAHIMVDNIIQALNDDRINYSGCYRYEAHDFWHEVKEEINKL
jgi:hypothetical protein